MRDNNDHPANLTPPKPIAEFLDDLHASGQQIVPGSLVWLPHPTRPGLMAAAVIVSLREDDDDYPILWH